MPSRAVSGMTSAGTNSQLPRRIAPARRASGEVVSGLPCPISLNPPMATSASTSTPLPISPMTEPNRKLAASNPQNAALPNRLGLVVSNALCAAKPVKIAPAR